MRSLSIIKVLLNDSLPCGNKSGTNTLIRKIKFGIFEFLIFLHMAIFGHKFFFQRIERDRWAAKKYQAKVLLQFYIIAIVS